MASRRRFPLATSVALVVAVSAVGALGAGALGAGATRAWIDQPLQGSILALGPTPVTMHAASDAGIAEIRVLVDGLPAAEVPAPAGDLVTVPWTWTPPGLGSHVLTTIATSMDGASSVPASVTVTFVNRDELPTEPTPGPSQSPGPTPEPGSTPGPTPAPGTTPTPGVTRPPATPGPTKTPSPTKTPGPTPKPTPTPTPTPTPGPCEPQGPTLLTPEYDAAIGDPSPDLEWSYAGRCLVFEWQIEVSLSNSFNDLVTMGVVPGNQDYWPIGITLEACVDYWWRVVGIGEQSGQPGEYSSNGLFHVIGRACP